MYLLICLGSLFLQSHGGQCELTWDRVYGLLSAKLDRIILEQDVMKKEMRDLGTSVTAINQQGISFEKRLSEVAAFSQQMVVFQERLDNIDSHVKDIATAEVWRRTNLLRRGLEQEKATAQSRFEKTMNSTSDLSARVDILKSEVNVLAGTTHKQFNATGLQISNLKQDMVVTLYNASSLFKMFDSLDKTQSYIRSEIKLISEKTAAQIATVQQEVATTQRNTQTLQSRVDTFERMQSDLQSKTRIIETQVETTRGQISRLQHVTGTFVAFSVQLGTKNTYYNKETVIKFDATVYNTGGHYSTSTGIFTVPVRGVYVFMFNVEVESNSSDKTRRAHVELRVNGVFKSDAIVQGVGDNLTGGNAVITAVEKGDRVYVATANFKERYYIWPYRTTFSGAILHVN